MPIDDQYVKDLPEIYRAIFAAYPRINPARQAGHGLSCRSLDSELQEYHFGQILQACEKMEEVGLMEIKRSDFACPTSSGEELIAAITGITPANPEAPPLNPPQ